MEDDNDLVDFGRIELAFESQRLSDSIRRISARLIRWNYSGELKGDLADLLAIANRLTSMSLELHGYDLTDEQKKAGVTT